MNTLCPACDGQLVTGLREWHRCCTRCSYEGSTLQSHILEQAQGGDLDETERERALASLRQANFRRVANRLRILFAGTSHRPRMLDVGCAHGWFMEANSERFDVFGIEPDVAVANVSAARGLAVRGGFFPSALEPSERFEAIVFNDVLEHIPDINATLQACAEHLTSKGWLVVNAPCRRGFLYRLAKLLTKTGIGAPFDRLWQLGFPSPHVHYLDADSMRRLATRNGFRLDAQICLPSVSVRGLYARIQYAAEVPMIKALGLTVALTVAKPLLAWLPSDIKVWFLRPVAGMEQA